LIAQYNGLLANPLETAKNINFDLLVTIACIPGPRSTAKTAILKTLIPDFVFALPA